MRDFLELLFGVLIVINLVGVHRRLDRIIALLESKPDENSEVV